METTGRFRQCLLHPKSKSNLAQLKIVTLEILSEASGVDSKALFDKIDFVISDQTAHNLNVEKVAEEFRV